MILLMNKSMRWQQRRRRRWGWVVLLLVVVILLLVLLGMGVQIFWGGTRKVEIVTHSSSLSDVSSSSRFHHHFLLGQDQQYPSHYYDYHHHHHHHHHFEEEPSNTKTPRYLHLSFADAKSSGSAATVRIHFSTLEDTQGTPVVTYGVAATAVVATQSSRRRRRRNEEKQEGISTHITSVCGAPANQTLLDPSWQLHSVTLDHLQPNTLYHYQVGMAQGQGIVWNDNIYSFLSSSSSSPSLSDDDHEDDLTPPPPPYRYLVLANQGVPSLGMLGSLWTSLAIAKDIQRGKRSILPTNNNNNNNKINSTTPTSSTAILPIRSVHHIGGLSYAQGEASIWKEWFQMIQIYASHVPLLVGMGPSEYSYYDQLVPNNNKNNNRTLPPPPPTWSHYQRESSGGECGQPIQGHFFFGKTPTSSAASPLPFWYSQDEGSWLHTIVLSSEHDLRMESEQYQWLVNDLQEQQQHEEVQEEPRRRWIVVEIHRPLYHNQAKWQDEAMGVGLRRILEPLLHRYHVDLVVSGRYASYFRSCPSLWQSTCQGHGDGRGTTHVTIGTAGVPLDTTVGTFPTNWAASFRADAYGYGRITIYNASTLHWEFVQVQIPNDVTTTNATTFTAMMTTAAQERRRMRLLLEDIDVDDEEESKVLDEVWLHK